MISRVVLAILASSLAVGRSACQGASGPVFAAIDASLDGLSTVNREIYENPELKFEEHHAHEVLTDFLEEQGFNVTRSAYNISTAFIAEFSSGEGKTVSFNAEYDALPDIGHGCGHNLIATASVAAAIGVKHALENQDLQGRVVLIGTPAEEGGGGKIKLLEAGAYDNVDCSLMSHPSMARYTSLFTSPAAWAAMVTFSGAGSHASSAPWAGRNAMDGFVSAYTMAGLYRQQIQPTDKIHHIITDSSRQNLGTIPERAESQWAVRSFTIARREVVVESVRNILNAGASASNTSVQVNTTLDYWDVKSSRPLAEKYYKHLMDHFDPSQHNETAEFEIYDVDREAEDPISGGSTDQGNVSYKVPALHVMFPISMNTPLHTREARTAAGTDFAFRQAIRTGKTLALTGIDVLRSQALFDEMKEYFDKN